MKEVIIGLKNSRNNIAPRWGEFSGGFYNVIWGLLKAMVLGAIHQIFDDRILPVMLQLGIIALIPKGGKGRRYIANGWNKIEQQEQERVTKPCCKPVA